MLECVVNVSEGRDRSVLGALERAAGAELLDVHSDVHHHRSVLTLAGEDVEDAVRRVVAETVARIDLRAHTGVHPRFGAADVVPFVPLRGSSLDEAVAARDRFARWAAGELSLPVFLYGPERALPEVRRAAFGSLMPDAGPGRAHPTAGAVAAGARRVLVAYNLWLGPGVTVDDARGVARSLRGPAVRSLGLDAGGVAQVSCNLVDPSAVGPAEVFDAVAAVVPVRRAELVGLVPEEVLAAVPDERWGQLDLSPERTIEARLESARRRRGAGSGGRR